MNYNCLQLNIFKHRQKKKIDMAKKKTKIKSNQGQSEKKEAAKIDKALECSIKDGSWWSVMAGFGESFLGPFALLLNATAFQIGVLGSLPRFLSFIMQLLAVKLTNIFKSRKKIILFFVILQALTWPLIILISWLFKSVWMLIILAALYFIFGALSEPAWTSWMGDLVREDKRGKYFGRRNRITGFVLFVSLLAAGILLEKFSEIDTFSAFAILFSVAFLGRLLSWYYLWKQYEPSVEIREPKKMSFLMFVKDVRKNNFGMFSLFSSLMMFSVYILDPLFVIYWLQYFKFSYLQYMVIISAASIATFITMTYWGRYADKYGSKTILWVSSCMIVVLPLFWYLVRFLGKDNAFIASIIIQAASGFAWAGFNLASSNFVYDSVEPENRIRFIGYNNALKGIAILFGGLLGGLLGGIVFNNPDIIWIVPSGLFLVMIISFAVRLLITIFLLNKVREVRKVRKRPHFFHFVTVMPVEGLMFDSVVGMNRTLKRFRGRMKRVQKHLGYWEKNIKRKI